jgi:hypothetical protein
MAIQTNLPISPSDQRAKRASRAAFIIFCLLFTIYYDFVKRNLLSSLRSYLVSFAKNSAERHRGSVDVCPALDLRLVSADYRVIRNEFAERPAEC